MNTRPTKNPNDLRDLRDLSRFLSVSVGFDKLFKELEAHSFGSASPAGYPPYNIECLGEDDFVITLAVAGFSAQDVHVEVEDRKLTVKAKTHDVDKGNFLHRGIARRGFERSFVLGEHVEVLDGSLVNGMLNINLKRVVPDSAKPRTITLTSQPISAQLPLEKKVEVPVEQKVEEI